MMKKNLLRQLGITITTGLICSFSILYAWNGLTASTGDSLTAVKWNELVDKVSGINTGVTGDRVSIGSLSPHANDVLSIYNNEDSVTQLGLMGQSLTTDISLVYRVGTSAKAQVRYYPATDSLNLGTQGDYLTQLVLEKGGNVGIGTNNPDTKLDVNGFIAAKGISINHATDAFINIKQETGGDGYAIGADVDWGDSIVFRPIINNTMGLPNVIFKTNGNVGIGTIDPKSKLEINGGNLQVTNGASGDWSTRNAGIIFARTDYPENYLNLISNSHSGTMGNGTMTFELATGASTRTSVMVLQNDGDVGIGETNPTAKLHVNGTVKFPALPNCDEGDVVKFSVNGLYCD